MAPRAPVDVALRNYTNDGGWDTTGLAAMIGMVTPLNVLIGYDCTVHMGKSQTNRSTHALKAKQPYSGRTLRRIYNTSEGNHVVCCSERLSWALDHPDFSFLLWKHRISTPN